MEIKEGFLVTGNERNGYGITSRRSLCIVTQIRSTSKMNVKVVAHADGDSCSDTVAINCFEPCTYEEFMKKYPGAKLVNGYTEELLKTIKNEEVAPMAAKIMNKETIGNYTLTDEERSKLSEEMILLLRNYDYSPTKDGVGKIIREWEKNNGWMINLFKKHPNYNGKYQIVMEGNFQRSCDKNMLREFKNYLDNLGSKLLKEHIIGKFSYEEVIEIYNKMNAVTEACYTLYLKGYCSKDKFEQITKEKNRWKAKYDEYRTLYRNDKIYLTGSSAYTMESVTLQENAYKMSRIIRDTCSPTVTEDMAEKINKLFPKVKAVAGQKMSRVVRKWASQLEFVKDENWEKMYAKYSDSINPKDIKRKMVLSCHPIDYLTMSFGNSWASCHTIDKHNRRGMENSYDGCYSSGTLSYMLDGSSFVFYTVDEDYKGDKTELESKINRNMFHIGEDKLIQGRVYPQTTDGEDGVYKQIREVVQKVIADCLGIANEWTVAKGTGNCESVTTSRGTHYTDYLYYSDCNVSYIAGETNLTRIEIGHKPICPCCGHEHSYSDAVECESCYDDNDEVCCADCGSYVDREYARYIDGEWYCEDCTFYCNYHGEDERGDSTFIEGYGYVCDDALESGEFYYCRECEEWHRKDGTEIYTVDNSIFCCEECAENADYYLLDNGEWYPECEVIYCEHCEEYVHKNDWNTEHECCNNCLQDVLDEDVLDELEEEKEAV